ncbi:hypothetical protein RIF29_15194 [Crotalaria pallida]|uniref:Uncharacterized protein n=1 Tax=Crotalaria pallida TaxID=3830 RepID=A0AAN9IEF2_CROPI
MSRQGGKPWAIKNGLESVVLLVVKLQDDNRALDRLTKSKEAAHLEAERTVQIALAKASLVDDLQNKNQELMKQIEIFQEENRILDKMHRQKVAEVEKLTQTVHELEEAVLAGGAAANAVRGKKSFGREVARAKVLANRVATIVANEWKDEVILMFLIADIRKNVPVECCLKRSACARIYQFYYYNVMAIWMLHVASPASSSLPRQVFLSQTLVPVKLP